MAAIDELIAQVENPELRDRLQQEVSRMNKHKRFGLVFEEHLPECTPLHGIPVKPGSKVARKTGNINELYQVLAIREGKALCLRLADQEKAEIEVQELVCAAQFGEPIYPYLKPMASVCRAPDSDLWHTLIEADNYHALQLLEYLYAGKVDCIYIDPPYNTGAKDWKYNNDYVDGSDIYRHSKWLSMMQKRLRLAKRLLNPTDSVLIVTIDEKEYLHLGCLLEEIFQSSTIQMISAMTNKKGSTRPGQFSRAGEYVFIVYCGNCTIAQTRDNMMLPQDTDEEKDSQGQAITIWNSLLRRGTSALRVDRPNLFYPIYVDKKSLKILHIGDSLEATENRNDIAFPSGLPESAIACWPMRKNDVEGRWQVGQSTLKKRIAEHRVKAGQFNKTTNQFSIVMLKDKQMEQIETGVLKIIGTDDTGAYIVEQITENQESQQSPRTIWVRDRHDSSIYGSTLLGQILPGHKFPFPKSLYVEQDTLRFFVANKPNALIIDFFAGSGTTLHAVNLLNAEDGGRRRCILVTNNEVSADEAKTLSAQGFRPGDAEWEKLGIARYVTWPRTVCSIEGRDVNGQPLKGNYLGSDLPMAEGFRTNAAFFKLGFLDKTSVQLGSQFQNLLPVLWMKAGAIGPCPTLNGETLPDMVILPQNRFAVLLEETSFADFESAVNGDSTIETVYIVTDYEAGYRAMSSSLRVKRSYQLYRDYLDNFRINQGRDSI